MILPTKQAGLVIDNFIAIDLFGTNPDVKYCFLSGANPYHCHKLTSKWQNNGIYCSPITAKLLSVISSRRKRYRILNKWIRPLDLNVWHKMNGFRVMLIDANHAPGSVMLIIEGEHRTTLGRILYTGFFRADTRFYQNVIALSALQEKKFDVICIDSNYVDFTREEYPNRRSSAKEAANLLRILKYNGVDNVAIPVPIIGCESFLVNISRELKCKIWLHPERFEIAQILGIDDYFSETKGDTYIWTCSQIESREVLSTTDSHIIRISMAPYVMPNISLNGEREHVIQYSDHCSSGELRSFLSLLTFSRITAISNNSSLLVEDKLQNLSFSETETVYYCKEEHDNLDELLVDSFRHSWGVGLAFDYVFRKFYDQLSTVENLTSDENVGEMLSEASCADNFISEQHLEMNISSVDLPVDISDTWDSNLKTYSCRKLFTNFVSDVLHGNNESDTDRREDRLDEMAIFNMEYARDDAQKMEYSSQSTYDTKLVIGIIEKQYDVSVILDYLASTFYTNYTDNDSTEDTEFLSYMGISEFFNDFNNLFEEYRESNIGAMSVGIMNQSYHVEENICYDPSNAPTLPNVVHELLDWNPILELQQDDFMSPQLIKTLSSTVLKDLMKNNN
ncbi:hypothetical protein LOAG_09723 [Loa loa]|uniref:DNA repair metallo-beta-lactamase domain-containing protein n=1 Tax=Loa loa TaxID=7209 RepID=A0A1S0TRG6_LOALO|nr:hypothetical protein LOAG_09723 [Loa loa]EFO18773.2 hypothetical protein LOAG_09723 [Loa loa]